MTPHQLNRAINADRRIYVVRKNKITRITFGSSLKQVRDKFMGWKVSIADVFDIFESLIMTEDQQLNAFIGDI